ncbi:hypothetical protein [Chitinophaga qingshengii]|uniref:Uncharacterized protein n=1 Tax=Chitinophaga qingshengii TaxID=1569794 RepID=A0ABR7TWQ7_9BACT|nr:hypothetical protein [Chitinophaga qingshengii]MBC9934048.1 hypothetical protein [Chitinophaga qingshengii]
MRIFLVIFLLLPFQYAFSQSLTLADFDTIVSKQHQQKGLTPDVYRFINGKIDFASIYGSNASNGDFRLKGETFKKRKTKELLWVEIKEHDARRKLITCSMGYTAPALVISKMKEDLLRNGYKYRKKKKYYIKRKNRREYMTAEVKKHSVYVSEFDDQPEILFTGVKQLK